MKQHFLLGPQQWAFVVIIGGAACALPFVQTDDAPPTTRQQPVLGSQNGSVRPEAATNTPHEQIVLPTAAQQLPAWANADRSPFDDLVGRTAPKPEPPVANDHLPMQPLRPWITAPGESLAATHARGPTTADPIMPPTVDARDKPTLAVMAPLAGNSPTQASPWTDQDGWNARDGQNQRIGQPVAQSSSSHPWPDQKMSAEEIARLAGAQRPEPTSALVQSVPPTLGQRITQHPISYPAMPQPLLSQHPNTQHPSHPSTQQPSTQQPSTRAVAAQLRFGQSIAAGDYAGDTTRDRTANHAALPGPSTPAGPPARAPATAITSPPLPVLPESRKQHIIFQPSSRK